MSHIKRAAEITIIVNNGGPVLLWFIKYEP
jgi:hypothetical protein